MITIGFRTRSTRRGYKFLSSGTSSITFKRFIYAKNLIIMDSYLDNKKKLFICIKSNPFGIKDIRSFDYKKIKPT